VEGKDVHPVTSSDGFKEAMGVDKKIATREARIKKVNCPYCVIGTANMVVTGPDIIGPGDHQDADVTPKKCDKGGRTFRIGYSINWVGIRMEGE